MTAHAQHQMHPHSIEVYRLYQDVHLSIKDRCYNYILTCPGVTDEQVAAALFGTGTHRQKVAPRITELITEDHKVEEAGERQINGIHVRTLRPVMGQLKLV